ncbi:MAG: iron-sulfur cluster assembly scaffold protein [Clostridia bacterium]|nr:iron-sulfur cluster assembly scaffold protein [Clostridia bacterium]
MYSERIIEEFYNPQNYGVIKGASGVGKVVSDIGSEIIKIYISTEGDKITDAQFQTYGGVVALACSSVATTLMIGKSLSSVLKINANNILEILGDVPAPKMYVVQAVVNAIHGAAEDALNSK